MLSLKIILINSTGKKRHFNIVLVCILLQMNTIHLYWPLPLFFFLTYLFIWQCWVLVVTCDLLVAGCEISFPHQRRNLNPLRWERGVLATGLTSKSSIAVTSAVSDSVRPHRWQPTRLPRLWDSLGKNTGVGCHFLLQWMKVKSESEVSQSCPILPNSMDCSLPGSSTHGIFQARVLEWVAIAFSGNCMSPS